MSRRIEHGHINPEIASELSASDYLSLQEELHHGRLDRGALQKFLGAMLPAEGQPTRDQVRGVINAIAEPRRLNKIVESILTDTEQLEETASKAFGHSTGMERIELAAVGQFSLRVHFWMPGSGEPVTEDPHNHVYNFGSKVLSGVLVTDLFTPGEEGDSMSMFQIATQNTGQKPEPEQIGEARLERLTPPQGIILTDRDASYTMSHYVTHRVRQGDATSPIITINLRGGNVKDMSTFFRDETMQSANPTPTQVDVENRLDLLRRVMNPNMLGN